MYLSDEIKKIIIDYLFVYNPEYIGVFGSYARNEQTNNSDIDILVSFKNKVTLLDLSKIIRELSENINIKVDLISEKSLNEQIKEFILKDIKYIYHA